jgi:hypothetical protein
MKIECRLELVDGAVLCPRSERWLESGECAECRFLDRVDVRGRERVVLCTPEVAGLEIAAALNVAGMYARATRDRAPASSGENAPPGSRGKTGAPRECR